MKAPLVPQIRTSMVFSLVSRLRRYGLLRLMAARQWKGRVRCLLDIFMMPHAGSYSLTICITGNDGGLRSAPNHAAWST